MLQHISPNRPTRILHVVGGMNRGGVETWLMHVLRHIDRTEFQMDFLVHTERPCAYDEEIISFGSRIIPCLSPARPWVYIRNLRRVLRTHGPYDVVHSHVHHFSGLVLRLAQRAGVPVRIAHSHSDTSSVEARARLLRRAYLKVTERWIDLYATSGLACSRLAASSLYGSKWTDDPRWQPFYCGIDLPRFRAIHDPKEVRSELNIPPDALVIGHVGRFVAAKNHGFLVEVAAEVVRRERRAVLLLIGDGPLRSAIENQANAAGIGRHVRFAGVRQDVSRLMLGAMDVFLLPSRYEGLPVALLEAQAAGLRCVYSDAITREVEAIPRLLKRESLSHSPGVWADVLLTHVRATSCIPRPEVLDQLEGSPFDIRTSVLRLQSIYHTARPGWA